MNHDLTRLLFESWVRLLVPVTEIAVFWQLWPLVVLETSTVRFPSMDDQASSGASRIEQPVQGIEVLERTGVVEWTVAVEERAVDVDQQQGEAMAGIDGRTGGH